MQIIHTSDWHLGQHFIGKSRQAKHQALIDWVPEQVHEHASIDFGTTPAMLARPW